MMFLHSTMNAGKSTHLLQNAHNYKSHGFKVLYFVPNIDSRFGFGKITSRIGIEADAIPICQYKDITSSLENFTDGYIFVDEVQFLDVSVVEFLRFVTYNHNVSVFMYGLKNNFKGQLFSPAIEYLLANSDQIVDLGGLCFCGEKANHNLRYDKTTNQIIRDGEIIDLGVEDKYLSVCNKHFLYSSWETTEYLKRKNQ